MYLAASGLSDSLQTLSCGLWDLVPWPGIEPLVEHILIQENIAEKMQISYNSIRLRESLLKFALFKGWHLSVYLPNKTGVIPYLAFVQCDFHSALYYGVFPHVKHSPETFNDCTIFHPVYVPFYICIYIYKIFPLWTFIYILGTSNIVINVTSLCPPRVTVPMHKML